MMFSRIASSMILICCACCLSGCLERREHLTISPDGGVLWQITHETDSLDEMYMGDAAPRLAGGWLIQEQTERGDDGKDKFKLMAEASFKKNAQLPSNYALRGQADAESNLQFPTLVRVQKRSDGTYYQFNRVYKARPSAEVEFIRQKTVQEPLKEIGIEPEKWTDVQRISVVKALASFEVEKLLLFSRAAYRQALPEAPQDGWLAVRDDMHAFLDQMDYQTLADLIQPKNRNKDDDKGKDENELAIQAEAKKFQTASEERLKTSLRTVAGLDGSKVNAVMAEYDIRKKANDVTDDLNDDNFEITVDMPGEIIASNAESMEGKTLRWAFKGEMLHDREIELMATSRVPK